ncbi:MAG: 4Fe-4S binding protein [Synergistaceae bacterium]|nr:4Fe-4S binding protein [Synergistaceae bacterium]
MAISVNKRKKSRILRKDCVACGACVNVCPVNAVSIYKGIWAGVDPEKCIGCSKCEKICPASAITMEVPE